MNGVSFVTVSMATTSTSNHIRIGLQRRRWCNRYASPSRGLWGRRCYLEVERRGGRWRLLVLMRMLLEGMLMLMMLMLMMLLVLMLLMLVIEVMVLLVPMVVLGVVVVVGMMG